MRVRIVRAEETSAGAISNFNERLARHEIGYSLPLTQSALPISSSLSELRQELFVAVEGESVRGGYILKTQRFRIAGADVDVGNFQLPVSEGIFDPRFTGVGSALLFDAMHRQPMLYALGIGSRYENLSRMLQAAQWSISFVPFLFRAERASRVLKRLAYLRRRPLLGIVAKISGYVGVGAIGIHIAQRLNRRRRRVTGVEAVPTRSFGVWADDLWQREVDGYGAAAERTARVLNQLYPPDETQFLRWRVLRDGRDIGWSVMLNTKMRDHPYFGDLRVATLVDGYAGESDVPAVIQESLSHGTVNADLVVSNQSHVAWRTALKSEGFLVGPSNYLLASSPALTAAMKRGNVPPDAVHMTRGDGDGPINL